MSDPRKLHREAREVADSAQAALEDGRRTDANDLFSRAATLEARAADAVGDGPALDRAVLLRSASALAFEAGAMSDIVERLRAERPPIVYPQHQRTVFAIMDEAADEIERLRAHIAAHHTHCPNCEYPLMEHNLMQKENP